MLMDTIDNLIIYLNDQQRRSWFRMLPHSCMVNLSLSLAAGFINIRNKIFGEKKILHRLAKLLCNGFEFILITCILLAYFNQITECVVLIIVLLETEVIYERVLYEFRFCAFIR